MILPGSYASGFAPRDGMPLYPELWRGCVAAWAPCLGPTGLTLREWSRSGNHGTLANVTVSNSWLLSRGRYSIDLDGTNDSVSLDSTVSLGAGNFGFSGWFNHDVLFGGAVLIGTGTSTTYLIVIDATTFYISLSGGFSSISHGGTIVTGSWLHYAITRTGTTLTVYVNGVSIGSSSNSGLCDISRIGSYFSGSNVFDGKTDDIRIYDRPLSPTEIRVLASRRGIAYELAPRRRASSGIAFNRRRRLLVGAHS